MTDLPKPPAHVAPYVDVLGTEGAIDFFLTFGGSELYLSATPKGRSQLVEKLGRRKAEELAKSIGHLKVRIPTTKPWIARTWRAKGLPVAEIARKLHMTDVSVRRWLRTDADDNRRDPRQSTLF